MEIAQHPDDVSGCEPTTSHDDRIHRSSRTSRSIRRKRGPDADHHTAFGTANILEYGSTSKDTSGYGYAKTSVKNAEDLTAETVDFHSSGTLLLPSLHNTWSGSISTCQYTLQTQAAVTTATRTMTHHDVRSRGKSCASMNAIFLYMSCTFP